VVILSVVWYLYTSKASVTDGALSASGTIEADQVTISPELGGRVVSVAVVEGDHVTAGQVLVQLDPALLQAQRLQAEAGLHIAQASAQAAQSAVQAAQAAQAAAQAGLDAASANRDLLQAGALPEQLQAAQAQVAQTEASLHALQASFDALTAGSRPEDITAARQRLQQAWAAYTGLSVNLSEDQLDTLRQAHTLSQSNLARAQARQDRLASEPDLDASAVSAAQREVEECTLAEKAAQAALQAAQDGQPYYLQIQAARESWDLVGQNLSQARARLDYLKTIDDLPTLAVDTAQEAVDDAQDLSDSTQEAYDALVDDAQAKRLDQAWKEVQDAHSQLNNLGRAGAAAQTSATVETLLNQLDAARALRDAAAASLALLEKGARSEQLAAAQAQVVAAQAQLDAASAQLQAVQFQAKMAQAQVESAQAALDLLDVQIAKLTLVSPVDGVVLSRSVEPGEMASPGASLLGLGQLQSLTITVYIPEDRYGEISLGESAEISVDSFPGEVFTGRVTHIADKAEFTPRNVQTSEGRRTTVFAIQLALDANDGRLKPGMPADVTFKAH